VYFGSYNQPITFSSNNRCSIYSNRGSEGADFFADRINFIQPIALDTCTVLNPWNFYVGARWNGDTNPVHNPFTYDIQHAVHEEVNHDLYVAPWGDDNNSGLNPSEPMKTIYEAIYKIAADSLSPKTVFLAPGYYSPSANDQKLPIPIKRFMRLIGDDANQTVIDAENLSGIIRSAIDNKFVEIKNMNMINSTYGIYATQNENLYVENVTIRDLPAAYYGALFIAWCHNITFNNVFISNSISSTTNCSAIYIINNRIKAVLRGVTATNCVVSQWMPPISIGHMGEFVLEDCIFSYNTNNCPETMNSIFQIGTTGTPDYLNIRLKNCLFANNYQVSPVQMANVISYGGISSIENCTFVDNTGGSNTIYVNGDFELKNNVFYNYGLPYEVVVPDFTGNGLFSNTWLSYNNIQGGQSAVYVASPLNHLYWGEGNIDADPLFMGGLNPYYPAAGSPLIDAGSPTSLHQMQYDLAGNLRFWDGDADGNNRIDIGCYEYQPLASPTDLAARQGNNTIHLSWIMEMDSPASGYRIYRNGSFLDEVQSHHVMDYIDRGFTQSDTLTYQVTALYHNIESDYCNPVTIYLDYVDSEDEIISPVRSFRVYPNPFSSFVNVAFTIDDVHHKTESRESITIYNLKGQRVKTIFAGNAKAGETLTYWDGCDEQGYPVSNGIYLLRLAMDGKQISTKKLSRLR
jgi:hypothetical protein